MSVPTPPHLFTPLKVGAFSLAHRVVMPALSRRRAEPPDGLPNALMALHYAQRATEGGLIVTETSWCHAKGHADRREPGLYSPEQVNAWRTVTRAVRARGAVVLAQMGDPMLQQAGLSPADVDATLRRFRDAAEGAGDAGFDGVELLGTLPARVADGGVPQAEHLRLLLDVVLTLASVWPSDRVALRLAAPSPDTCRRHPDAVESLAETVSAAFRTGVACVHVGPSWPPPSPGASGSVVPVLSALRSVVRPEGCALVVSGGIDGSTADTLLSSGQADAVAFGRDFMTNPDLPWRLHCGAPLAPPPGEDSGTGAAGYVDHPVSDLVPANVRRGATTPEALRCDADPWRPGLR